MNLLPSDWAGREKKGSETEREATTYNSFYQAVGSQRTDVRARLRRAMRSDRQTRHAP